MNTVPNSGGNPAAEKVTLVSVGEIKTTETGKVYVEAYFKKGIFGRSIRRSFWGTLGEDGQIRWERATPEELQALVGQDLTGQVFIEALDVEPKEIVMKHTGEIRTVQSAVIVRMVDETVESAARFYGVTPRQQRVEVPPLSALTVPPGFHVVGGDGKG